MSLLCCIRNQVVEGRVIDFERDVIVDSENQLKDFEVDVEVHARGYHNEARPQDDKPKDMKQQDRSFGFNNNLDIYFSPESEEVKAVQPS